MEKLLPFTATEIKNVKSEPAVNTYYTICKILLLVLAFGLGALLAQY